MAIDPELVKQADVVPVPEGAAATSTEAALARIWSEILDIKVGARDSFIDFTDSLSATEYVNRVRDTFKVAISPTDLLDKIPNVAKLAELIDRVAAPASPPPVLDYAQPTAAAVPAPPPRRRTELGPHALPLPGGTWSVWKTCVLRGAGFPARLVRDLSADDVAIAADLYLASIAEADRCLREALAESDRLIPSADPATRPASRAAKRRLRHGRIEAEDRTPAESALAAALAERAARQTAFLSAHDAAAHRIDDRLRDILADDAFREAGLWQNRSALNVAWRRVYLRQGSAAERRHAAAFVAMLAQRYAVKNDSIGFFGPVGWAELSTDPAVVDVRPGERLVCARNVYFEGWAIEKLTDRLNQDPTLKPWTAPRVKAGVWIGPDHVYAPLIGKVPVTADERDVLRACDGERTAREIAGAVGGDVFAILDRLVAMGLVSWRLEVAPQLHPERELQSRIERIGDAEVRARCEAPVDSLCSARDRVARAAGHPERLDAALADLDATFTRVTGCAPSRRAGEMYAGRGLVYEDCRRDGGATLGREFLDRLGPPLSIVLDGARWVSTELRQAFRAHLRRCHAELRETLRAETVDAHLLLNYVGGRGREALAPMSADLRRRFQERWLSILAIQDGETRVRRSVEQVREPARQAFAASGPSSWGGYFTPDIMVAAAGPEAFHRGEFECVLGEVHDNNTLLWSALAAQHADPAALDAALACDTAGEAIVVMQTSKERWLSRLSAAVIPTFWRYEHGDDMPPRPACRPLPAALLVTVDDGAGVRARARDGRIDFDAYELFAVMMSYEADRIVSDCLPGAPHRPRITIGDLTISRERWQVTPRDMPFLGEHDRRAQYVAVRAWARARGMPERVFYKSPGETKPCYLDFASPIYVDVFVRFMKQLRDTVAVRIVEMFPDIEDAWLTDAAGRRYTSELRIVARTGD